MSELAATAKTKKIRYSIFQIQFQLTQISIVAKNVLKLFSLQRRMLTIENGCSGPENLVL